MMVPLFTSKGECLEKPLMAVVDLLHRDQHGLLATRTSELRTHADGALRQGRSSLQGGPQGQHPLQANRPPNIRGRDHRTLGPGIPSLESAMVLAGHPEHGPQGPAIPEAGFPWVSMRALAKPSMVHQGVAAESQHANLWR
jgi:hypothetical protein